MRAYDHLGLGVELVDADLTEGVAVEAAGRAVGGKATHKVARVDV